MGLKLGFLNALSGDRPVTGYETTPTLVGELAKALGGAAVVADVLDVTTARLAKLRKGTAEAEAAERAALVAAVRRIRLPRMFDPNRITFPSTDHHGRAVEIKWTALEIRPGTWEEMTRRYLLGDDAGTVTAFLAGIGNEWYAKVFRATWRAETRGEVS